MKTIKEIEAEKKAAGVYQADGGIVGHLKDGKLLSVIPTDYFQPDASGWLKILADNIELAGLARAQLETVTTAEEAQQAIANAINGINGALDAAEEVHTLLNGSFKHDVSDLEGVCAKWVLDFKELVKDKVETY